jgi:hypothetical protein
MTPTQLTRRVFLGGMALVNAPSRIIDTHTHFGDPTRPQAFPGRSRTTLSCTSPACLRAIAS